MGASLDDLATPFLYVDLDRMKRNIDAMAAAARELSVQLRPHAKTHKVPEIARLQIAAGASGVTLAKVSEAEVFADAGIDDLFLAYQIVSPVQLERLTRLARRTRLRCAVDRRDGAERLSRAAKAAGIALQGMREIGPGIEQGAMRAEDVALFARATVISRPAEDRAVVDAGSKTLSTDGPWEPGRGFGYLASDPSTRVASLWEEHGVLRLAEKTRGLRLGDRVSIVPNHVCTAVNLHDRLVAIHDDRVEVVWTIAARGRIE